MSVETAHCDNPGLDPALIDSGPDRPPLVALIGPPNSGKSTLFNHLTGLRQKVANYPGVTVEKHLGRALLPGHCEVLIVDLPGVNGFSARTLDERVTRDVLEGRTEGLPAPDALVLIVDSTRLETQLMLVEPVLALGVPTLLVLNMTDELDKRGGNIDEHKLSVELGVDVIRANARAGIGVDRVRTFLAGVAKRGPSTPTVLKRATNVPHMEDAGEKKHAPEPPPNIHETRASSRRIELPVVDVFVNRRGRIRVVSQKAAFRPPVPSKLTEALDSVFLHRVWGPILFVVVVALVFQAIFAGAQPMIDLLDNAVSISGEWFRSFMAASWYRSLLIDGVWMGVGSVVVFLPQILILFLFLGILEDSGYMARAAVIADRSMYRLGLQGRAFLPLLSAYACAVPAILAARTIEDERDRLATIFVAPFMTCSARLPVYALLIKAFVPEKPLLGPFFGTQAATLLGLYILGALAAIFTAFVLKRTLLKGRGASFMMELPPYRMPTLRSLGLRLYDRAKIFLRRAGSIILLVALILWGLLQFPRQNGAPPDIEASALGQIGHVMEPAIKPLGFNWKIGIGLVSSLAAREVIVGTLGTIYSVDNPGEDNLDLQSRLKHDLDFGGAIALLVFFAFALQCTSTIAVMHRETGGWKWPALQWSYMLVLAYVGAYAANLIF
ncbi:MAG: ferrous iron transport protein B [Longimicrobiales bacterium]